MNSNIQSNEINIENFPSADAMKKTLYKKNINRALAIIYQKFEEIDLSNPSVLIMKSDFHIPHSCAYNIPENILQEVIKFLTEKGYRINEIQDTLNNYIGWKIYI